jgi:putative ABC transport system permease protein
MNLASVVIGIFVLVYAALVVIALRRPLLARLALREAVRRPWQSAVVVLGLMVGTVSIFAMQVFSDSALESQTHGAYLAWGHVDLVAADGGRFFDAAQAAAVAADPNLRSSLAGVQAGIELPSSVVDLDRNNAKPLVMLVGFDPATQAAFGSYRLKDGTSTMGKDLTTDQVLITASLADALEARSGDRLRVSIGPGQVIELRVKNIAKAEGPGAYTLRPALFVPLANLRPMIGDRGINIIRLAAPGDGRAELDRAHELTAQVRASIEALPSARGFTVREAKWEDVEAQLRQVDAVRGGFTGLSLFVTLAGSALVVNLGLALAEERRPRHAVLRALGLSRTGMVILSVLEGALYSLVAAVAALVPGAVVGLALVRMVFSQTQNNGIENRAWPVQYAIAPESMALSIAIGALIVLATLFATAVRSSRMQISSAIKNLPEPAGHRRPSIRRTGLLAVMGLGSLAALVAGSLPVRLAGGVGLVILAATVVGGRVSGRLRATLSGAALAVWAATNLAAIENIASWESGVAVALGAVIAVFGLSLVVAANLRVVEIPAGWLEGRARATLRPSLAYLTRRPLRAGLGIGAFALVLTLLTMSSVYIPTFAGQGPAGLDEYDIRVNAPTTQGLSLPDSVHPQIARAITMATRPYRGELDTGTRQQDVYEPLYALTRSQLESRPFQLTDRESRFKNDAEVWQALADDPRLVVSHTYLLASTVTLAGPDGPVKFHVAGVVRSIGLWGLAGSEAAMAPFATLPVGTTILAKTTPGGDAKTVARQIQREVFSQGAEVLTLQELSDSTIGWTAALVNLIRLVMGIGLLVGVLSLGILALRAAIERRRGIGMLRALGYRPGQVLAGIVSEALITATSGALVGIAVGLLISVIVRNVTIPTAKLEIDSASLAVTVGLIYLAVLVVTIPPALRAARLPAVEALRMED